MSTAETRVDAAAQKPPLRPYTGDEYLESLNDGREIWIYGERVKNVTTHPAFRNSARISAFSPARSCANASSREGGVGVVRWCLRSCHPSDPTTPVTRSTLAERQRIHATFASSGNR